MIPPNKGSSLSLDSSLNRIPRENCYISGYKGSNEIYQDVPNRVRTLIYVVKFLDPEDEIVTCGSLYKFVMPNSPKISDLVDTLISSNW